MFGAGLIEGVSMITVGEALGHEMWCDMRFLSQVTYAVNNSPRGIKARFTHPGLSSDGVGTKLGKFDNARVVGDQVIADMHFQEASTKTPDGGNLADYVMTLAEETPEDFGLSIVFDHDYEASDAFTETYTAVGESFKSPDEDNVENYMHARLHKLYACDAVDTPAANPGGLFKAGQEAAVEADALLEYAMGLSDVKPSQSVFGVDPDRAKQFFARWISRQGLSFTTEDNMSDDVTNVEVPAEAEGLSREDFNAELSRYVEAFGKENGTDWFLAGKEFGEAQALCIEALSAELQEANELNVDLQNKLDSLALGEQDSGEFAPASDDEPESEYTGFAGKIRLANK
jgi:hypothetical protein